MTITIQHNTKKVIKQLQRQYGAIEQTTAAAINEAAGIFSDEYKKNLKRDFTIKNKFTLGSIKTFSATAKRRSGEIRPMQKINAIVGVRKMKGGLDHYLKKQEEGGSVSGDPEAAGKVPVPIYKARIGGSKQKPIAQKNRMIRKGNVQQLKLGGARFGYNDRFKPEQRWAIMYDKRRKGKSKWDLTKPFIFTGMKRGLGIFKLIGNRIRMLRVLQKTSVRIKAKRTMQRSTKAITPQVMDNLFMKNAKKFIA